METKMQEYQCFQKGCINVKLKFLNVKTRLRHYKITTVTRGVDKATAIIMLKSSGRNG